MHGVRLGSGKRRHLGKTGNHSCRLGSRKFTGCQTQLFYLFVKKKFFFLLFLLSALHRCLEIIRLVIYLCSRLLKHAKVYSIIWSCRWVDISFVPMSCRVNSSVTFPQSSQGKFSLGKAKPHRNPTAVGLCSRLRVPKVRINRLRQSQIENALQSFQFSD